MCFYILNKEVYIHLDIDVFDVGGGGSFWKTAAAGHMMQMSHTHARIFSNGCFYKTWINEDSMDTVHPHHTHSFVAMVPHPSRALRK